MYLETQRMMIRNFILPDAADLHEILGDEKTMANCEPAYDFKKTEEFLASFCIDHKGAVAAVHKESGKVIGYILFKEIADGIFEMGWIFHRRFWRQGYAYEACKAVIESAFAEKNVRKIFAETTDPVKSVPLMEKLGMQFEEIQRERLEDGRETGPAMYVYSLLKEKGKTSNTGC